MGRCGSQSMTLQHSECTDAACNACDDSSGAKALIWPRQSNDLTCVQFVFDGQNMSQSVSDPTANLDNVCDVYPPPTPTGPPCVSIPREIAEQFRAMPCQNRRLAGQPCEGAKHFGREYFKVAREKFRLRTRNMSAV